uniref:Uncharacterized protein n=1 Tax=Adineta vaga TaxID=104782 RepID=B3G481_ADIVA|nr:unknown [Adineta vaga]
MSVETTVHALFQYVDLNGRDRTKKTNQFNYQTRLDNILHWILTWWKGRTISHIEIKDTSNHFVDFDEEYIKEQNPFFVSESTVILFRVIVTRDSTSESNRNAFQEPSDRTVSSRVFRKLPEPSASISERSSAEIVEPAEENKFSFLSAPSAVKINDTNPFIIFTKNVNDKQRDQYETDKTKAATGDRRGCFVRIQGDKSGFNKNDTHKAVAPMIKVSVTYEVDLCTI